VVPSSMSSSTTSSDRSTIERLRDAISAAGCHPDRCGRVLVCSRATAAATDTGGVKVHGEKRDTQIYALTLARSDGKLGPKISKTTDDCAAILTQRREAARAGGPGSLAFTPPGPNEKQVCSMNMRTTPASGGPPSMTLRAGGQPLQVLVGRLSAMLNTQVVDRTGLRAQGP
jgi:uncharacterized protein (TIGR03435 family)